MSKKIITWFLCLTLSTGMFDGHLASTVPSRSEGDEVVQTMGETGNEDPEEGTITEPENGSGNEGAGTNPENGTEAGTPTAGNEGGNGNESGEPVNGTNGSGDEGQANENQNGQQNGNSNQNSGDAADKVEVAGLADGETIEANSKSVTIDGRNVLAAFDITLWKNGVKIQPSGAVTVTLKGVNPSGKPGTVFYMEENEGGVTPIAMPTTCEGDDVKFTTTHFSSYAFASDEEKDGTTLLESMTLTQNDETLKSDSTITLSKNVAVSYKFKSGLVYHPANDGEIEIQAGVFYELPGIDPEIFDTSDLDNREITIQNKTLNNTLKLGELHVTSEGKVYLHVTYDPGEYKPLNNVTFGFSVGFDETKIALKEKIELHLLSAGSNYSIEVLVAENEKAEPTLKKTGSIKKESTGYVITWEISVTNAKNPILHEEGYRIEDEIKPGQEFVDGSLEIAGISESSVEKALTSNPGTSKVEHLRFDYKNSDSKHTITFTYKTKVAGVVLTEAACKKMMQDRS